MLTQQLMFCLFSFQLENGLREISTRKNRNATPLRDGKLLKTQFPILEIVFSSLEEGEGTMYDFHNSTDTLKF